MRWLITAIPATLLYVVHWSVQGDAFIDDAWIFYRYAANAAAGHGLVYNVGEHVEGYSSLAWTVLLAAVASAGVTPHVAAPILGLVFGVAVIVLTAWLAAQAFPHSTALRLLVPIASALSTGLAFYAASGMDTTIAAASLLFAIAMAYRALTTGRIGWLAVALVLLVPVRAEGPLFALVILAVVAVLARQSGKPQSRPMLIVAGVTCLAVAVQFGGRWLVYGELVPATVSAKGYMTHLLGQLPDNLPLFLVALAFGLYYQLPFIALCIVPAWLLARRGGPPLIWLVTAPIVLTMAVSTWGVGDWMPFHRHHVSAWSLALLLFAWAFHALVQSERRRYLPAVAVLVVGLVNVQRAPVWPGTATEQGRSLYKHEVGVMLAEVNEPTIVVTNVAGKLAYYAGPNVYIRDSFGLADAHNATQGDVWAPQFGRTDYAYTFGEPWDVLVTNNARDLVALVEHWRQYPSQSESHRIYLNPEWTAHKFFVVADATHPVGHAVRRLCACSAQSLTEALASELVVATAGIP